MTNTPAGWYDNPQDTTTIRYWDGQQWTDHLAPRPGPGQANPTQPGYGVPNDGQPVDAQNAYQPGYPDAYGPTTPDGVPLAGYGSRVGAYILDGIFSTLISLVLSIPFLNNAAAWYSEIIRSAGSGAAASQPSTAQMLAHLWPIMLITVLVTLAYQIFFLNRWGATPGKRIVGISVRRREVPGPLSVVDAAKRVSLYVALQVVSLVPVVGSLVSLLVGLLDLLWPLWDSRRQALHDKIAGTNVVQAPKVAR